MSKLLIRSKRLPYFEGMSTDNRLGYFKRGDRLPILEVERSGGISWVRTDKGWVVAQQGKTVYAVIEESKISAPSIGSIPDMIAPPDRVDWSEFSTLLPDAREGRYILRGAQMPSQPNGRKLPSKVMGTERINCTNFTVWLVPHAMGFELSRDDYAAWQNFGGTDVPKKIGYGPGVCVNQGMGKKVTLSPDELPASGSVYLIQHFKGNGGHSWLLLDTDPDTGRILTLEATKAWGVDGVGWAGVGSLRDVPNPGDSWRTEGVKWTSRMKGHRILACRLNVSHKSLRKWLSGSE